MKILRYAVMSMIAVMLSASGGMAQTILTNSYTNSFSTGGNSSDFSGSGSVHSWLYWYGVGYGNTPITNDITMDAGGDSTSGSLFLDLPFTTSYSQNAQIFGTFDNQYGYDGSAVIPLNIITNMGFDIYVSTNTTPDANGNYGSVLMSLIDSGWTGGGRTSAWTNYLTIPAAAKGHWVHLQDTATAAECLAMQELGFTQVAGMGFYFNNYGDGGYPNVQQQIWIDNVSVQTSTAPPPPPPPPTVNLPKPAKPGLNVFFSTEGNSFYDRQEVELINNHGLSWVGNTGSGPVSYSFTISGFPTGSTYSGEAYMFLVPNPTAQEGAPDWNENNCAIFEVQSTANGGQGLFQYKTNAPNSEPSSSVTNVQSSSLLGTWTLEFTSDTNGVMIAPDGTTASFTIPSDVAALFAESSSFNIYLGGQANSATYINQAVVYSNFSISGLGSANMNETFVGESTLSANWTNVYATGPAGVLIVPTNAAFWESWTVPAIGYSLIHSGSLAPNATWTTPSSFQPITMYNLVSQLISKNDLSGGNQDYFELVKRTFSQLLVLLPGQTNTPGVAPGYGGTATPLSMGGNPYVQELVTVQAVDAHWNPVPGILDTIQVIAGPGSDPNEITPNSQAMVNGSLTFGNSNPFFFSDQGTWTITVQDMTSTNIPNATSGSVVVGP